MLSDILRAAFARAHERRGLVFLDMLWKAVWLVCTVAASGLVVAWFGSKLRGLEWEDTGTRALNTLIAAEAVGEFWSAMKAEIVGAVLIVILLSVTAWFVLEALFRLRFVNISASFPIFLLSNIAKSVVIATAALILVPIWLKGAPFLACFIFLGLVFCLALVETLIRADAVELLGTDLIRVTVLIGILMSFEMMVAASFVVMLTAGFLNVARLGEALAMLGISGMAALFLTVLHSYLLLVRFSAVDIMRQNVVAV
jgi:hypothetical protein